MFRIVAALALTISTLTSTAIAQSYPSRPIRVIVPFEAGGAMDVVMRLIVKSVTDAGGPTIVVENKTGGGGVVGSLAVKTATPDGYTLLMASSSTHVFNPHMMKDFPFDPIADFTPIVALVEVPRVLAVPASLGVGSLAELHKLSKTKPEGLSYGSGGVGSAPHLTSALMQKSFDAPMTHVPYRGVAPAINDLVAGRIDFVFGSIPSFQGHVASGKLRFLAVAGKKRLSDLPNVPHMAELGYPEIELDLWFGILAPAGTDSVIVGKLQDLFATAAKSPDLSERFKKMGLELATGSSGEFAQSIKIDNARIAKLITELGIADR